MWFCCRTPRCVLEPQPRHGHADRDELPIPSIASMLSGRAFEDPSEPIYTDPSLFERSRSLRSIAISQAGHTLNKEENNGH